MTEKDIRAWLDRYEVENYTINGTKVDVVGDVNLSFKKLERIEVDFNSVSGNFYCSSNKLLSLVGCPKTVGGHFSCSFNPLKNLKGAPQFVTGDFLCNTTEIASLEGAPELISGKFDCSYTAISSLAGAPLRVNKDFNCSRNKISNLVGAPAFVGNDLICHNCELESFEGVPSVIGGNLFAPHNTIKTLTALINTRASIISLHHNPALGRYQNIENFQELKTHLLADMEQKLLSDRLSTPKNNAQYKL